MRYKRMGTNRSYRLNVPELSGGVNVGTDPTLIEDNELTAVRNLEWKNGALRTRKAVRAVGDAPIGKWGGNIDYNIAATLESICAYPFEVDGEMCTVIIDQVKYTPANSTTHPSSQRCVRVVTLDGIVKKEYTAGGIGTDVNTLHPMVAVPCDSEKYGCDFLVYHGRFVYKPDDETMRMLAIPTDELYAPLVMINGKSMGYASSSNPGDDLQANGVMYEGFNTMTNWYRTQHTSMGQGTYERYYLPTKISEKITVNVVTADDSAQVEVECGSSAKVAFSDDTEYTISAKEAGYVVVQPPLPKSTPSNNVTITCCAADSTEDNIAGATLAAWFGGTNNRRGGTRLFLAGFTDDKAKVMWSDVNNPLYFPENNYVYVGDLSQRITALEKQDDMLVIFKEREMYYTTYVQGSIDEEAVYEGTNVDVTAMQAYFPLTQLSPYIGCDCPHTIVMCQNRLVWLCTDGRIYTLATAGQYSERNVREIGGKIRDLILSHDAAELKNASAADYDEKYRLLIGKTAYLFDYTDSGFLYTSAYYSGEKAAKRIAWYVHELDGFPEGAVQRIVSDGAYRAIVISTQSLGEAFTHVRTVYKLGCDGDDRYLLPQLSEDGSIAVTETLLPIGASLTTKAYDFGDIASFKRIKALYLAAQADKAQVRFIADRQEAFPGKRFCSQVMDTHLVMPSVKRCKTLSIAIESDREMCIKGLRLQYAPFGIVK